MLASFIVNCIIVIVTVFGFYAMFKGWDFMGKSGKMESRGLEILRFFTIDSNVLAGVCSFIVTCAEIPVLFGNTTELSPIIYVIKLMGTSSVTLTFVVTVCFLVPQFENPILLYYNSNFFFHLFTPLMAIGSFVWLENTDKVPLVATLFGVLPTLIYATYYIVNVFMHLQDGKADKKYDFYNFLRGNIKMAPFAILVIFTVSYLFSLLLWWGNRSFL